MPMRAVLTALGAIAASLTLAACGGKSTSTSTSKSPSTPSHRHDTNPHY
jgi:ABC-type glycerol-3-phosphate transport system substrate-binding protein